MSPVELADAGGGGAKSCDGEKAWYSCVIYAQSAYIRKILNAQYVMVLYLSKSKLKETVS